MHWLHQEGPKKLPYNVFSFTLHAEGSVSQIDVELYKMSSQTFHKENTSQIPMKASCLKVSHNWRDPYSAWLSPAKWLSHFT